MTPKTWVGILFVFLVMLLVISLLTGRFIFFKARQYYLQLNSTRLDPLGLTVFPSTAYSESEGGVTAVFFGDSRAASWPPPDLDTMQFINRGIGGQTSTQVQQRFGHHVTPLAPDLIIIQVGINDLKTIPLFPDKQAAIITACKENIGQMVSQSTEMGAVVILTTIFPVGTPPLERRPFWSDDIAQAVIDVNTFIYTLASDKVLIFDAHALLANDKDLLTPAYAYDELHLNEVGYTALNEGLTPLLATLVFDNEGN